MVREGNNEWAITDRLAVNDGLFRIIEVGIYGVKGIRESEGSAKSEKENGKSGSHG